MWRPGSAGAVAAVLSGMLSLTPCFAFQRAAAPPVLSITQINRERPSEDVIATDGYVVLIPQCPPCPKGAVCKPSSLPYIVISERNSPLAYVGQMTSSEVVVQTILKTGFRLGPHYRFIIRQIQGAAPVASRGS